MLFAHKIRMGRLSSFSPYSSYISSFTCVNDQVNAGGSAMLIRQTLLHDGAVPTHVVTQQGRGHLVKIPSENGTLTIANVHLVPGSNLIFTHWPTYPDGLGVVIGNFNICEPEEGRFNVTNHTFSDGDPGRSATFRSISFTIWQVDPHCTS